MTYEQRLFIAKVLITSCVVNYSIVPLFIDFGSSHIGSEQWTPHGRFHLSWTFFYHVLALPVLLYVLWSKLHGTGRSVRLVGFLGLAQTGSFFVALSFKERFQSAVHDVGHEHLVMGMDGNAFINAINFVVIAAAILLSIRR